MSDTRMCLFGCDREHVLIDLCTPGVRVDSHPGLLFTCASRAKGDAVCTGGIHAQIGGAYVEAVCSCACHACPVAVIDTGDFAAQHAERPESGEAPELPPELLAVLRDPAIPLLSAEAANDLLNKMSDAYKRLRAEAAVARQQIGGAYLAMRNAGMTEAPIPVDRAVEALLRDLAAAQAREQELRTALRRARAAIDRDKTGLVETINKGKHALSSRQWITEGRGSYEWNDDRYRDEARLAFDEVRGILVSGLSDSGCLADAECRAADVALALPADDTALQSALAAARDGAFLDAANIVAHAEDPLTRTAIVAALRDAALPGRRPTP